VRNPAPIKYKFREKVKRGSFRIGKQRMAVGKREAQEKVAGERIRAGGHG